MKTQKIIYYIATGLLSALMLFSAGMYFLNNAEVNEAFISMGYPTYLIYPLAIAKILGVIAIWQNKNQILKEWAYAGFFFDLILAFSAHYMINDGQQGASIAGLVFLIVSYYFGKRIASN